MSSNSIDGVGGAPAESGVAPSQVIKQEGGAVDAPTCPSSSSPGPKAAAKATKQGEIKSVILQICMFILVTEFCERLAFYGLTGSLPVFFSKVYKLPKALSTELNTLFSAVNYVTPLVGAFVADKYLGRFKTIGTFCVLYVVGMALCVMGAVPDWADFGQPLFYIGLFGGVALGAGGIKPNVVVLGADQFDLSTKAGNAEKDRFFGAFYWAINVGAAVSFGLLTNLAVNGVPGIGIPEQWGFFWSFLIPAVAMCLAVLVFFAGAKRVRCCGCGGGGCLMGGYKMLPPKSSALGTFLTLFGRAAMQTPSGRSIISACVALLLGFVTTIASYFIPESDAAAANQGGLTVDTHFVVATAGMVCILYACLLFIVVGGRAQWMHLGYHLWAEKQALEGAQKTGGTDPSEAAAAALVAARGGRPLSYGTTATATATANSNGDGGAGGGGGDDDDSVVDLDAVGGTSLSAPESADGGDVDPFKTMELGSHDALAELRSNTALLDACEVVRLLPYFAYIVVFWAVYGQMSNNFVVQGCQMNLFWAVNPAEGTSQLSSAFLNLFDTVVILVFIPIFDGAIYPCFARCRKKGALTVLEKVGSGFFFCMLSMVTAGVVEILRKDSGTFYVDPCCANMTNATALDLCCAGNATCSDSCVFNSNCASEGTVENMSRLSVWYQAFQFLLIGIAEILTSVSSYELFYTQVPKSMRSTCQALNLLTTSIGFMVTGGINSVFQFWIPNNLNDGKLENVYFFIGALSLFAGIGYIFTSQSFVYSNELRDDLEVAESIRQSPSGSIHSRAHSTNSMSRRGSSVGGRSTSGGGAARYNNRTVSHGSHRSSYNPRERRSSVNSAAGLRSRSRSRYTYSVTGLTCASGSEHVARSLTLVPPTNSDGVAAPPLPTRRRAWGPSRSTSFRGAGAGAVAGRRTPLPELLVSDASSEAKARTTGLLVGYDENHFQVHGDSETASVC